jgi:mitochondrial import receptor subunit TOM40
MFYALSMLHITNIFSGVLVLHYLQTLTPSLALGGELAYQRGPALPGGQIAIMSGAGRYTHGNSTFSGSISK